MRRHETWRRTVTKGMKYFKGQQILWYKSEIRNQLSEILVYNSLILE